MPLVIGGPRSSLGSKGFDLYRCILLGANVPDFRIIPIGYQRKHRRKGLDREMIRDLEVAFEELGGDVAVRSSCIDEDREGRSNAGRFKTVLNVRDMASLILAVEMVWDSAEGADMAVIVQRQLHPSKAGVVFTLDPVTMEDRIVVEYVKGLANGLVQGKKTPVRMVFKGIPGPISPFRSLVREAIRLSKAFGYPLDIEWALCEGELYILQARPMTALGVPPPKNVRTYSRVLAEQFNSGPVSPLYFSFFRTLHERYFLKETMERIGLDIYAEGSIVRHKDHLYFDTRYVQYALSRSMAQECLDGTVPEDLDHEKRRIPDLIPLLKIMRLLVLDPHLWIWNLDRYFINEVAPQIVSELKGIGDFDDMTNGELSNSYERILDVAALQISVAKWGLALYSIPLAKWSIGRIKECGTTDASRSLQGLADIVRDDPELLNVIGKDVDDPDELDGSVRSCKDGGLFRDGFNSMLKRFGHRRLVRDIMKPSWKDDPRIPLSIIRKIALTKGGEVYGLPIQQKRGIIGRYADRYATFREEQRFYLDMIFSKARELFVEIGIRMERRGVLPDRGDVFFIDAHDAIDWLEKGEAHDLARKATFNKLSFDPERPAPGRYMRLMIDFDSSSLAKDTSGFDGDIFGEAISPGMFRGRVRILRHADEGFGVEKGDVIVTGALDPGQTHLLMLAGALVLEVGGTLSHGAILAREKRIPTVGQVKDATRILRDGQTVLVDGSKGLIVIRP